LAERRFGPAVLALMVREGGSAKGDSRLGLPGLTPTSVRVR
jgi:hypothetical protein